MSLVEGGRVDLQKLPPLMPSATRWTVKRNNEIVLVVDGPALGPITDNDGYRDAFEAQASCVAIRWGTGSYVVECFTEGVPVGRVGNASGVWEFTTQAEAAQARKELATGLMAPIVVSGNVGKAPTERKIRTCQGDVHDAPAGVKIDDLVYGRVGSPHASMTPVDVPNTDLVKAPEVSSFPSLAIGGSVIAAGLLDTVCPYGEAPWKKALQEAVDHHGSSPKRVDIMSRIPEGVSLSSVAYTYEPTGQREVKQHSVDMLYRMCLRVDEGSVVANLIEWMEAYQGLSECTTWAALKIKWLGAGETMLSTARCVLTSLGGAEPLSYLVIAMSTDRYMGGLSVQGLQALAFNDWAVLVDALSRPAEDESAHNARISAAYNLVRSSLRILAFACVQGLHLSQEPSNA